MKNKDFNGSLTCEPCPAGYYAPNRAMGSCLPCPSGTFAASIGSRDCTSCPVNTYIIIII